mgnify:FL=1
MSFKKDKPTWREDRKREVPPEDEEMLKEANSKKNDLLDSEKATYKDHIDGA